MDHATQTIGSVQYTIKRNFSQQRAVQDIVLERMLLAESKSSRQFSAIHDKINP